MRRTRQIVIMGLTGLIMGLIGLVSCTTDTECRQNAAIYMMVEFTGDSLRLSTDSARLALDSTAMDTISFSTITGMQIRGVGRDSIICDSLSSFSKAKLPLKPDTTVTSFELKYNGLTDTVNIHHENDMQFISLACGCFVYHTLQDVSFTRAFVDSCDILNTAVTTASDTHLRIYFHKR